MFEEQDGEEGCIPIPQKGEEVFENYKQMIAPCDADEEDTNEDNQGPEEAGHRFEGTSELLNGKSGGVDRNAIHTDCDGHSQ